MGPASTMARVPAAAARAHFVAMAAGGAVWWVLVYSSETVRTATLGGWDPDVLVVPDSVLFIGASVVAAATASRVAAAIVTAWSALVTAALLVSGLVEAEAGWGVVLMTLATTGSLIATAALTWGGVPTAWFFRGPFAFRVAPEGHRHLVRSLGQLVVFWTVFFVVVPVLASWVEERLQLDLGLLAGRGVAVCGWVVFLLGSAVGVWACVTMAVRGDGTPLPSETARHLVATGPYRYVRNPMAVAGAFQTAAVGLIAGSWIVLALAVVGAVVWDVAIRPEEEADLADRLGPPYEAYRSTVRCWVPTRPGPPGGSAG